MSSSPNQQPSQQQRAVSIKAEEIDIYQLLVFFLVRLSQGGTASLSALKQVWQDLRFSCIFEAHPATRLKQDYVQLLFSLTLDCLFRPIPQQVVEHLVATSQARRHILESAIVQRRSQKGPLEATAPSLSCEQQVEKCCNQPGQLSASPSMQPGQPNLLDGGIPADLCLQAPKKGQHFCHNSTTAAVGQQMSTSAATEVSPLTHMQGAAGHEAPLSILNSHPKHQQVRPQPEEHLQQLEASRDIVMNAKAAATEEVAPIPRKDLTFWHGIGLEGAPDATVMANVGGSPVASGVVAGNLDVIESVDCVIHAGGNLDKEQEQQLLDVPACNDESEVQIPFILAVPAEGHIPPWDSVCQREVTSQEEQGSQHSPEAACQKGRHTEDVDHEAWLEHFAILDDDVAGLPPVEGFLQPAANLEPYPVSVQPAHQSHMQERNEVSSPAWTQLPPLTEDLIQSVLQQYSVQLQGAALLALYCLYCAQPWRPTVKIYLTAEHQEALLGCLPRLQELGFKDAVAVVAKLLRQQAMVVGSTRKVEHIPGNLPGGGLLKEEQGVVREVRFHLKSTLHGLGTSNLEALCSDYEKKLLRIWACQGRYNPPESIADLACGRVLHEYTTAKHTEVNVVLRDGRQWHAADGVQQQGGQPSAASTGVKGASRGQAGGRSRGRQPKQPQAIASSRAPQSREAQQQTAPSLTGSPLAGSPANSSGHMQEAAQPEGDAGGRGGQGSDEDLDPDLATGKLPPGARRAWRRKLARQNDVRRRAEGWRQHMGITAAASAPAALQALEVQELDDIDHDMPELEGLGTGLASEAAPPVHRPGSSGKLRPTSPMVQQWQPSSVAPAVSTGTEATVEGGMCIASGGATSAAAVSANAVSPRIPKKAAQSRKAKVTFHAEVVVEGGDAVVAIGARRAGGGCAKPAPGAAKRGASRNGRSAQDGRGSRTSGKTSTREGAGGKQWGSATASRLQDEGRHLSPAETEGPPDRTGHGAGADEVARLAQQAEHMALLAAQALAEDEDYDGVGIPQAVAAGAGPVPSKIEPPVAPLQLAQNLGHWSGPSPPSAKHPASSQGQALPGQGLQAAPGTSAEVKQKGSRKRKVAAIGRTREVQAAPQSPSSAEAAAGELLQADRLPRQNMAASNSAAHSRGSMQAAGRQHSNRKSTRQCAGPVASADPHSSHQLGFEIARAVQAPAGPRPDDTVSWASQLEEIEAAAAAAEAVLQEDDAL